MKNTKIITSIGEIITFTIIESTKTIIVQGLPTITHLNLPNQDIRTINIPQTDHVISIGNNINYQLGLSSETLPRRIVSNIKKTNSCIIISYHNKYTL